MDSGVVLVIVIIGFVLIMNLYLIFSRIRKGENWRKRRGKGGIPIDEEKRAQWREKEVARRIAREQDDAMQRVSLRNETLAYYEAVKQRHLKMEAMERLGMKPEENPDDMTNLGLDEYLNIR